jgi:hypothetical protein
MEDVLEVYQRPRDPDRPLVCLDEASKQLIADTRAPIPMKPGRPARADYEYERNGTANLFMMFAPLEGWRHVKITDRRTSVDCAHALKDLSDAHLPGESLNASNGTTRPNTAVGSIWPSPNSPCWLANVSTAASPIAQPCSRKSQPGKKIVTNTTPKPIASSQPKTPALNSGISIPFFRGLRPLDSFAGSGTTGAVAHKIGRQDLVQHG